MTYTSGEVHEKICTFLDLFESGHDENHDENKVITLKKEKNNFKNYI